MKAIIDVIKKQAPTLESKPVRMNRANRRAAASKKQKLRTQKSSRRKNR